MRWGINLCPGYLVFWVAWLSYYQRLCTQSWLMWYWQMWGGGWGELIYIFIFLKKSPGLSAQDYEQSTYLFSYSVHDWSCVPPGIFYWWRLQFTSPQEAFWGPALRVGFFDGPVKGGAACTAPMKWEMIRGVMFCYVRFKLELSKLLLSIANMATRWYSTLCGDGR